MTATANATDGSTITELAQTVKELKKTVESQTKWIDELEETVAQQTDRIDQLEAQSENELIDIKSEEDTTGLVDIWIAGIPLGSILQKTTEDVDRVHNWLGDVEQNASKPETPGVDTDKTGLQKQKLPLNGFVPYQRI